MVKIRGVNWQIQCADYKLQNGYEVIRSAFLIRVEWSTDCYCLLARVAAATLEASEPPQSRAVLCEV